MQSVIKEIREWRANISIICWIWMHSMNGWDVLFYEEHVGIVALSIILSQLFNPKFTVSTFPFMICSQLCYPILWFRCCLRFATLSIVASRVVLWSNMIQGNIHINTIRSTLFFLSPWYESNCRLIYGPAARSGWHRLTWVTILIFVAV